MGFLIRSAFWLSLVLLIIPIDAGGSDSEPVGAIETFVAARVAMQDVAGLCERRPEVCATGRAALDTIGSRAREGARIAYEFIGDDTPAEPETAMTTGSVAHGE